MSEVAGRRSPLDAALGRLARPAAAVPDQPPGRIGHGAERAAADPAAADPAADTDEEVELDEDVEPDEEPDEETRRLARGFAAGDRACLEEAYRRWSPLVHTLARRELADLADAEDVTQQVFVSAWRSRADLDPARGTLAGWLVGITRHRLLDHHRRQQRQQRLASTLEGEAAHDGAAGPPPDADLDRLVLAAEIRQLPDPRGTIMRMAYWEGYSHAQIAEGLGLPLGTVKSHVRRTLLHLRDRLRETATWPT